MLASRVVICERTPWGSASLAPAGACVSGSTVPAHSDQACIHAVIPRRRKSANPKPSPHVSGLADSIATQLLVVGCQILPSGQCLAGPIQRQPSRLEAFSVGLAYYIAASWPLIPGVLGYFAQSGTMLQAFAFWIVPSLLLPLPWIGCWGHATPQAPWRVPLAYFLSVALPSGIIGWASPLTAVGILFPSRSWGGQGVLVAISALAVSRPMQAGPIAVSLALAVNGMYPGIRLHLNPGKVSTPPLIGSPIGLTLGPSFLRRSHPADSTRFQQSGSCSRSS